MNTFDANPDKMVCVKEGHKSSVKTILNVPTLNGVRAYYIYIYLYVIYCAYAYIYSYIYERVCVFVCLCVCLLRV